MTLHSFLAAHNIPESRVTVTPLALIVDAEDFRTLCPDAMFFGYGWVTINGHRRLVTTPDETAGAA